MPDLQQRKAGTKKRQRDTSASQRTIRETTRERHQSTHQPPAPDHPVTSGSEPLRRLLVLTVGALTAVVILWLLVTSVLGSIMNVHAIVTIQPRTGLVTGHISLKAVTHLTTHKAKKSLHQVLMSTAAQAEHTLVFLPLHGTRFVPAHAASGIVRIGNRTAHPLTIPAGTLLSTADRTRGFVTTKPLSLSAATITFDGARYPSNTVPVVASAGGVGGDVPPHAITVPPPALADKIEVENTKATTGGTSRAISVVDPADSARVATQRFAIMTVEAQHDLIHRYGPDITIHAQYIAKSPLVPHNTPDGHAATLTLSIVLHAAYVHNADLHREAMTSLATPASETTPSTLVPTSVHWTTVWTPENVLALTVTGHTAAPVDIPAIQQALSGLTKAQALAYLRNRPDLQSPTITLSPPWADSLPSSPTGISVTVRQPQ